MITVIQDMKGLWRLVHIAQKTTLVAIIAAICCIACSKEVVPDPVPPVTTPPTSPPTGMIDYLKADNNYIAYNNGTVLKWSVSGTNKQTEVTLNGVKVPFSLPMDTGPLKQTTTFTLVINNGVRDSVTIRVADSISSSLWNNGAGLKLTKRQVYIFRDSLRFVDTTINPSMIGQVVYFSYKGESTIMEGSSRTDAGPFVIGNTNKTFTWRGTEFTIVTLDTHFLTVEFDDPQPNGGILRTRHFYTFY